MRTDSQNEPDARVDVETSRDQDLFTGKEIVRVKYRRRGERRWTKLIVVPDEDQTVEALLREGHLIADAHLRASRPEGGCAPDA